MQRPQARKGLQWNFAIHFRVSWCWRPKSGLRSYKACVLPLSYASLPAHTSEEMEKRGSGWSMQESQREHRQREWR